MKRVFSLKNLLILLIALSLIMIPLACGDSESTSDPQNQNDPLNPVDPDPADPDPDPVNVDPDPVDPDPNPALEQAVLIASGDPENPTWVEEAFKRAEADLDRAKKTLAEVQEDTEKAKADGGKIYPYSECRYRLIKSIELQEAKVVKNSFGVEVGVVDGMGIFWPLADENNKLGIPGRIAYDWLLIINGKIQELLSERPNSFLSNKLENNPSSLTVWEDVGKNFAIAYKKDGEFIIIYHDANEDYDEHLFHISLISNKLSGLWGIYGKQFLGG